MNVDTLREDFPVLGQGFVYLDSATTSLTPKTVADRIVEYYTQFKANPLRSVHTLATRTEEKVNQARAISAGFINASPEEIVFVRNSTEGLNLIARGLKIAKDGNVVVSALEHHSNYVPWLVRCRRSRKEFRVVFPKQADGIITIDDFAEKIDKKTRVVALTHVSNVLGTISPVEEVVKVAHENGAYVLLDAAQSAPHLSIDVKKLNVDFLALSAHKICGPTGSGLLYVKRDLFESIEPINFGGGACYTVDVSSFKLLPPPFRFEAGTIPFCEVMMMADGFQYVKKIGLQNILDHDRKLIRMAHELVSGIKNFKIYGPDVDKKTSIFTFNLKGIDSMEVGMMLDSIGQIEVRSGHMCAQVTTRSVLGEREGVVRASTYFYNNEGDIEKLTDSLKKITSAFL
ncbi:MAG: cysteine desulfurase [Nitrososphaeria archaeon]|jgi:cysteine desulfurase/selenocysteine lyase